MLYFRYLLKLYLKNVATILLGLSLFYIVVDFATHFSKLPDSINLQILYLYYSFLYGVDFLYPLALLFGFLLTLNALISRNELVAFFGAGFRRRDLLKPILGVGVVTILLGWAMDSSPLAYSLQNAEAILEGKPTSNRKLFLKWEDKVISIEKIEPFLGEATGVKIFYLSPTYGLYKVVTLPKAKFTGKEWAGEGRVLKLEEKRWLSYESYLYVLPGFRPKVVANLKKLNSISFVDAYFALRYFKDLDINSIASILLFKLTTPLLVLGLIIIIFLYAPIHRRLTNLPLFMVKTSLLGVMGWGIQLLLFKFAKQGALPPYLLLFPVVVVVGVVAWKLGKKE